MSYRIVRHYKDRYPNKRIIVRGLTLEEAQAHCHDPETSSSTCTSKAGKARTRRVGAWFDGYEEYVFHAEPRRILDESDVPAVLAQKPRRK